jgi:hypothetical protein
MDVRSRGPVVQTAHFTPRTVQILWEPIDVGLRKRTQQMKSWNWTRAWLLAAVIASGTVLINRSEHSRADEPKVEKKVEAAKKDITPEAGYGTLTGQFVLVGAIPALPAVGTPNDANGGDIKTCGGTVVASEKLVVDAKSKGIANIFVYLQKAPAKIHPKLVKSPDPVVIFDQKICQFHPRNLLVRIDQTVKVMSGDPVPHNTHTHPIRNQETNTAVPPNERKGIDLHFKAVEKLPIQVGCDIHRWMLSWWLILDHPYAAVTDADGKFSIGKLPAGEYEFIVWHESPGYLDRKFKVTIPDNGTDDKGVIKVPVEKFKL